MSKEVKRTKRYRYTLSGNGFSLCLETTDCWDLPSGVIIDDGPENIIKALQSVLSENEYMDNWKKYEDEANFLIARRALDYIWPLFVEERPNINNINVIRGPGLGSAYVLVDGKTILHTSQHEYHTASGPHLSDLPEATGLYEFLLRAKISLGDFVALMLAAIEHPLSLDLREVFFKHHVVPIHTNFRIVEVDDCRATIMVGETPVFVNDLKQPKKTTAMVTGPICHSPWLTPKLLSNGAFWADLVWHVQNEKIKKYAHYNELHKIPPYYPTRKRIRDEGQGYSLMQWYNHSEEEQEEEEEEQEESELSLGSPPLSPNY